MSRPRDDGPAASGGIGRVGSLRGCCSFDLA